MQVNSFQLDQLDQLCHAVGVAKRSVAVMYQPQLWAGGEVQIVTRPGIAILATQSGVPIHSGCSQGLSPSQIMATIGISKDFMRHTRVFHEILEEWRQEGVSKGFLQDDGSVLSAQPRCVAAALGAMAGPQRRATPRRSTPLPGRGDRAGKHQWCRPLGSRPPWRVCLAPHDVRLHR